MLIKTNFLSLKLISHRSSLPRSLGFLPWTLCQAASWRRQRRLPGREFISLAKGRSSHYCRPVERRYSLLCRDTPRQCSLPRLPTKPRGGCWWWHAVGWLVLCLNECFSGNSSGSGPISLRPWGHLPSFEVAHNHCAGFCGRLWNFECLGCVQKYLKLWNFIKMYSLIFKQAFSLWLHGVPIKLDRIDCYPSAPFWYF